MPTVALPTSGRRSGVGPVSLTAPQANQLTLAATGHRSLAAAFSAPIPPVTGFGPAISVELWNDTDTAPVGPIANTNARSFEVSRSTLGESTVSVPIGNSAEQIAANQLSNGRHIRYTYQGRLAHSARIVGRSKRELDSSHALRRTTIRAQDKRTVLDRYKVRTSWPEGSQVETETRRFGWMSKELSTAGWPSAVVVQPAISLAWQIPNSDPPWFQPWEPPKGWARLLSNVIQCRSGVVMPAGEWVARGTVTIPSDGFYMFQMCSMGGPAELFFNSTKIAETSSGSNSWLVPVEVTVPLKAQTLHVGLKVKKENVPQPGGLPGTLANFYRRSLFSFTAFSLPDGPATVVTAAQQLSQAGASWKVLDYPSRLPAPTVGRILRALVEETGAPVTLDFTDTTDSAGRPWPLNDETTFRDSDSIWDALTQLQAKGYESEMSTAGYTLRVYGPAPFTGSTPIRVSSADRIEEGDLPNRLIVQYARGKFTVERAAAEVVEEKLELGEVRDEREARAIAEAELDRLVVRADRWLATPLLGPGDGLFDSWRTGSWVGVSGENVNDDVKVETVTVSEDDRLFVSGDLVLTSPLEDLADRLRQRVDRISAGALGASSSPVRWLDSGAVVGFVQEQSVSPFSQGRIVKVPEDGSESTVETFDVPVRVSLIRITAVSNPGSPGIFVRVRRGGQNLEPILWLPPGVNHAVYLPSYQLYSPMQNLSVAMIDAPEGAGLVSVAFHAAVAAPGAVRPERPLPWL